MDITDLKAYFVISRFCIFLFFFVSFSPVAVVVFDMRSYIEYGQSCAEWYIDKLFDIGWIDENERREAYNSLYGR